MLLTESLKGELVELGVLDGDETCALCRERPLVLLDVARAPILLCLSHTRDVVAQLTHDLDDLARSPEPAVTP